jgi:hypothetical protein
MSVLILHWSCEILRLPQRLLLTVHAVSAGTPPLLLMKFVLHRQVYVRAALA